MHSLTIAPFFTIALVCNPSRRSPRADKWTVSQTKSDMNSEYIFTQKISHGCETHTVVPHGNTKERTDRREKDGDPAVLGVSQKFFFFIIEPCCCHWMLFKDSRQKGGLVFGMNSQSCQHKWSYWWNRFSFSCSEKTPENVQNEEQLMGW